MDLKKRVRIFFFLMLLIIFIFATGCVLPTTGENVTSQGLQIVVKDIGFPEVKFLQPTIIEIQLQNEDGQWISIWNDPEGKTVKLTPDGAEMILDTVNVPAGTYIGTRIKVSTINVEADINRDGDVLDKNVEIILTEEEFNQLPEQEKPQAPQGSASQPPSAPEKPSTQPSAPSQPEAPSKPTQPSAPTGSAVASQEEKPEKPSEPERPPEPEQPPEPSQPSAPPEPSEPTPPYRIEGGLVYTGSYLDEQHTVTLNDYIVPLGDQMWETDFVYSGHGGRITYDFSLSPLAQMGKQITIKVSIAEEPIQAFSISALAISPDSLIGGTTSVGKVTLDSAAPVNGQVVQLSAVPNNYVALPSSVTVKAGETSATFNIETKSLPPSVSVTPVTITAQVSDSEQTALLTINPFSALTVSSLTLTPASVKSGAGSMGTVTLNYPAPRDGVSVILSSPTRDFYKFVSFSSWMRIGGGKTSGSFNIITKPVTSLTNITFLAKIQNNPSKEAILTISPDYIIRAISALTLSPDSAIAGDSLTGTVTLNGPASVGGQPVQLWALPSDSLTLPSGVIVKAGETTATFHIDTKPATSPANITITAKSYNYEKTILLVIEPFAVA